MFTVPLRRGQPKILYLSAIGFTFCMSVAMSLSGFLTHVTTWFLERIIIPSINACPPTAKEGSLSEFGSVGTPFT